MEGTNGQVGQMKQETKSDEFVQKMMEHLMGNVLDSIKMSDMGERQLNQVSKFVKNNFNDMIRLFKEKLTLKEE